MLDLLDGLDLLDWPWRCHCTLDGMDGWFYFFGWKVWDLENSMYICRYDSKLIIKMEQEEINKEIEWLMGSIKRSCARSSSESLILIIALILFAGFGVLYYVLDDNHDFADATLLLMLGGIIAILVISYVNRKYFRKKLSCAETPQELLATYDRMWMVECAFLIVAGVGMSFGVKGGIFPKICFVMSILLMAAANWLSMKNRLKLWVGILLLLVESVLLYFSNIGLLLGLSLLMVMLSIIEGRRSLFGSRNEDAENIDVETEQEIKRLRELVNGGTE